MGCQLGRHRGITLRNPTRIVGYEAQPHPVIPDIDIWMMPCGLGDLRDPVDELHRRHEILEAPIPDDLPVGKTP